MSQQVVWAAKLLFSNPYNEVLRDHFTLLKHAWLRKVQQLHTLIMSSAELRTYQRDIGMFHLSGGVNSSSYWVRIQPVIYLCLIDTRSYVSRSVISPARQINITIVPTELSPPPLPLLPEKVSHAFSVHVILCAENYSAAAVLMYL